MRAISTPPPRASPLTKANGRHAAGRMSLPNACVAELGDQPGVARSRDVGARCRDRSAPAARMNGLPVMPTAWISPAAARAPQPVERGRRARRASAARSVFGRVWSRPLSSVTRASTLPPGSGCRARASACHDLVGHRPRSGRVGVEVVVVMASGLTSSCRSVVRVLPDDASRPAEADAHRGQAVAHLGVLLELARRAGSSGARRRTASGWPSGDGAAPLVDPRVVVGDAEVVEQRDHLDGERLVELEQADVARSSGRPCAAPSRSTGSGRCP